VGRGYERLAGLDSVEGAFAYEGGMRMTKPSLRHRSRIRLELPDGQGGAHELYMKLYDREPPAEMLRRWRRYGMGGTPAAVEWDNIEAVRSAGIATMKPLVAGEEVGAGRRKRSYLVVSAVPGGKLEETMPPFLDTNASRPERVERLTAALADLARRLHGAGLAHRDFYSSHVFLDEAGEGLDLYLIDLARVFRPRWRRPRWRVKDLAQIKSSVGMERWAEKWWPLFMRRYLGTDGEGEPRRFSAAVDRKAAAIRAHEVRKQARERG
jgi:hypothetical protein